MDPINRGRSPSVNASTNIRHTPSPSPHQGFRNQPSVTGLGLEQAVAFTDNASFNGQLANSQQAPFGGAIDFSSVSQSFPEQNTFAQNSLFQDQGLAQANASAAQFNQDSVLFSEFSNLNDTTTINGTFDGPLFQSTEDNTDFIGPPALDPRLLDQQQAQQSPDPNNLMAQMTSQAQSPTPPHLLSPAMHRQSSQSPHGSPALNQGGFQSHSPAHSRNTSLDPSSAAYPQMQAWAGGDAFRGHRRAPSDAHSDVSSSAHPSPYLGNVDSFEQPISNHSPLLGAQQDPAMYQDITQPIEQFSISQGPNQYISPAHSPVPSPRLVPQQQPLPVFTSADNFGLQQGVIAAPMPASFNSMQGIGFLPSQNQDQFPDFGRQDMGGQADTMSPPEISIQLAPPSRQSSFEPPKPDQGPEDSLSPPERSRSRNRMRAKSDPFSGGSSRASTPGTREKDMLSPAAAGVGSRSPSPSTKGRRSSTSSVPNRDYILDLADPSRPSSNNSDGGSASKRIQKHPATFQCSLCPKRFTRAYNLRSHLRTHTDERPFVCSVCGKAFARQHDRKRHEGLHSGEKKFVCRGQLKDGNPWGCGRRFARADALGRHFRSEAGRVCIKPLLEEEALERMQQGQDQNAAAMQQMPSMGPGMVPGAAMMQPQPGFDPYGAPQAGYDPNMVPQMPYRLPAALLQQYPTLGGIWDTLPANAQEDVEGNISGRSSFDAGSSAGEYDDGEGEYTGGPAAYGWASDVGP